MHSEAAQIDSKQRKAVWIVPLAFVFILTLVTATIVISFNTIAQMRQGMARVVDEYNTQTDLVQSLQVVVQQRMTIIRELLLEDDVFERDDKFQALNRLGGRYNEIFSRLEQLALKPQAQLYLDEMRKYVRDTVELRLAIRDLVFELAQVDKNYILRVSNETQDKYQYSLGALLAMLKAESDMEWTRVDQGYQAWIRFLWFLSIMLFISSLFIAYWVSRYIHRTHTSLHNLALQKSMLLATMSHEIRTPLTSIIGFSETLLESDITKEERISSINAIVRNGRHLQQLINDILDFSKLEANQLELHLSKVEVKPFVDDLNSLLRARAESKGLGFNTMICGSVPEYFYADETKLKQTLVNLLGNAIKFTAQGGVQLQASFLEPEGEMQFEVIDTGIGLDAAQQREIFDPYKQVFGAGKEQGTGLGLYLSRQIALMMGGSLTVESEPGKGSCFCLRIPAGEVSGVNRIQYQGELVDAVKGTLSRAIQLQGNVLLAEDREDNQKLFSIYMDKAGVNLTIVDNGIDAVNEALRGDYALVLMDMQMPQLDGLSALRRLREQGYHRPVIALTANDSNADRAACLDAGFNDFLTKPISRSNFLQVLTLFLHAAESAELVCATPIYRTQQDEALDLGPAVALFVQGLDATYAGIKSALAKQSWAGLKSQVHDLKGAAGAVGYPQLTKLAMELEFALAKEDTEELAYLIQLLGKQIARIQLGYRP